MAKVTVDVSAKQLAALEGLFLVTTADVESVNDDGENVVTSTETTETVKVWLQRYVDNTANGQDDIKRMEDFRAFTDEEKDSAITAEKARK